MPEMETLLLKVAPCVGFGVPLGPIRERALLRDQVRFFGLLLRDVHSSLLFPARSLPSVIAIAPQSRDGRTKDEACPRLEMWQASVEKVLETRCCWLEFRRKASPCALASPKGGRTEQGGGEVM